MNRIADYLLVLGLLFAVGVPLSRGETATAPLKGTPLYGIIPFTQGSAASDTLNVSTISTTVTTGSAIKKSGNANYRITVVTTSGTNPSPGTAYVFHVADVVLRDGDSLYEVKGLSSAGGGGGSGRSVVPAWTADYNRGTLVLKDLHSSQTKTSADSDSLYCGVDADATKDDDRQGDVEFYVPGGHDGYDWTITQGTNVISSGILNSTSTSGTTAIQQSYDAGQNDLDPGQYTLNVSQTSSTSSGSSGSATTQSSSVMTINFFVVNVDISTDTNNDGASAIDPDNIDVRKYKASGTGRVVTVDDPFEVAGDPTKSDVAEIDLLVDPTLQVGKVTLSYDTGNDLELWLDADKTQSISLPKTWNLSTDTVPTQIYASAKFPPNAIVVPTTDCLKVEYSPPNQSVLSSDKINMTVIGPISRTPKSDTVRIWESSPFFLYSDPTDTIVNLVTQNGWLKVLHCIHADQDNYPPIASLYEGMANGGIIADWGHGNVVAVFGDNDSAGLAKAAAIAYCAGYPRDPTTRRWTEIYPVRAELSGHDCWAVGVKQLFYVNHWMPVTTPGRSIILLLGCRTSGMLTSVGGRAAFGYINDIDIYFGGSINQATDDMQLLFGCMTGGRDNGLKRTLFNAYGFGGPYSSAGLQPQGDLWTTLAPATLVGKSNFSSSFSNGTSKGCAGVIFDTYMDDSTTATDAVQWMSSISGSSGVNARQWMTSPSGSYGTCFTFDRSSISGDISMRAYAPNCLGTDNDSVCKKILSGNPGQYTSNYDWTVPTAP